jgi:chromatin segregation and condensation protein Rec8/ScpA/Scc1 (kleisin family)
MSRDEAIFLVLDLVSAVRDLEARYSRSNREDYEALRERVIEALAVSPSDRSSPMNGMDEWQRKTNETMERRSALVTDDAKQVVNEVLDYFQKNGTDPGGWWAFPDDFSSLCLDFDSTKDDTMFWLHIERDGTLRLVWRPKGGDLKSLTFVHRPVARCSKEFTT